MSCSTPRTKREAFIDLKRGCRKNGCIPFTLSGLIEADDKSAPVLLNRRKIMAFFDKLNDLAKTAGEKTGNAIEITKLSARIAKERSAINEAMQGIGEIYYARYIEGEVLLPETLELCVAIDESSAIIEKAQSDIARIKTGGAEPPGREPENNTEAGIRFCSACGAGCSEKDVFCSGCGRKL
jgi:hypothetical protein